MKCGMNFASIYIFEIKLRIRMLILKQSPDYKLAQTYFGENGVEINRLDKRTLSTKQ